MDSIIRNTIMANGTGVEAAKELLLPWNGWEEELFADCRHLLQDEEAAVESGGHAIKFEFNDGNCNITEDFSFTNDEPDNFSGELNDIMPSWFAEGDEIGLPDYSDGFQLLDTPASLNSTEVDTDVIHFDEASLCLLAENEANSTTVFDTVFEELLKEDGEKITSLSSVKEEHQTSSYQSDSGCASPESNSEENSDDNDWEWKSARKRSKKRKKSASGSPRTKKPKLDAPILKKREQNKNAATRYREKKKTEEFERQALCEELERKNKQLKKDIADKEQEVIVLKRLLMDVLKSNK